MAKLNNLEDLLIDLMKDTYDAEHQITKALPKMIKAATSPKLRKGFEEHLEVTEQQIRRLEQVFELMGQKASRKTCPAMKGLLEEGEETIKEKADSEVKDAALIASAQKVEHYEIAAYGTARTYARLLGYEEAAQLLQQTLNEEADTDEKLTQIAQSLNVKAMG